MRTRRLAWLTVLALAFFAGAARAGAQAAPSAGALLSTWTADVALRELRAVDPHTGAPVDDRLALNISQGEDAGYLGVHAYSPDGTTLAINAPTGRVCEPYAGGVSCRGGATILHLLDLRSGESAHVALRTDQWLGSATFNPDGRSLVLTLHDERATTIQVMRAAVAQGADPTIARRELEPGLRPSLVAYTHDAASLVLYATPRGAQPGVTRAGSPRLLLLDATSLETQWDHAFDGLLGGQWCLERCTGAHDERLSAAWTPAVVQSHDRRALYVIHADAPRLTTVDLARRTVSTADVFQRTSWLERALAFLTGGRTAHAKGGIQGAEKTAILSPNGEHLYVLTRTTSAQPGEGGSWWMDQSGGIEVIDVRSGQRIMAGPSEGWQLRFTPDGKHLLIQGWTNQKAWVELMDAATLRPVARLDGWSATIAQGLDGQTDLLGARMADGGRDATELALLDSATLTPRHTWTAPGRASWVGRS